MSRLRRLVPPFGCKRLVSRRDSSAQKGGDDTYESGSPDPGRRRGADQQREAHGRHDRLCRHRVVIGADRVTVDLNGHRLGGTGTDSEGVVSQHDSHLTVKSRRSRPSSALRSRRMGA